MKTRWVNKKINLKNLLGVITSFLEDKGFRIRIEEKPNKITLVGICRESNRLRQIQVEITGEPNDLTISFNGGEGGLDIIVKFASLLNFFGGGPFLLRKYEEYEYYHNLEAEFWDIIENAIEKMREVGK